MVKSRFLGAAVALVGLSSVHASIPNNPALLTPELRNIWAELLRIEDGRLPAKTVTPYLRHVDRRVRTLAARTLGRLGDLSARPHLEPRLRQDPDGGVRAQAALALGLIGATESIPELIRALSDVDAATYAARALGLLKAEKAVPSLIRLAKSQGGNSELRMATYLALSKMAKVEGVAEAVPLRPPTEPKLAQAAAYLVRRLIGRGEYKPPTAWLESLDENVRVELIRGYAKVEGGTSLLGPARPLLPEGPRPLKGVGRELKLALLAFLSAADRPPEQSRAAALWAALMLDGDPHVLFATLQAVPQALKRAGSHPVRTRLAPVVYRLVDAKDFPASLRAASVGALRVLDQAAFETRLPALLGDQNSFVRAAVASAILGDLDGPERLGRAGSRLWSDPDRRVQLAAVEALARREGAWSTQLLRKKLKSPEPPQVAAAAQALVNRSAGSEGLAADLFEALSRFPLEHHEERAILVALLAKLKSRAYLQKLKSDPDVLIREQVHLHLGLSPPPRSDRGLPDVAFYLKNLTRYSPRPRVEVETPKGSFEIRMNVAEAPLNTWNFLGLVTTGYFDGLGIHRVVPGFVAQGGDPRRDGFGGPGYMVRCELGMTPYEIGTVGMALAGRDTGGSQFFVSYGRAPHLEGGYTVLGKVAEGMEVVSRLLPGDTILGMSLSQPVAESAEELRQRVPRRSTLKFPFDPPKPKPVGGVLPSESRPARRLRSLRRKE